ncbi:2,6-dihydropseudooxynicotine hydrolase [Pleurostoma richardsiae]|uniref:2,6-dihydropseudooxynicotine hydrolase n=1 Tax=Pleurostoma richardsiae TaxID=41990 RepID=A0AA38RTZ8_9PEZI|nr:2,6-dihydropseudooxynicotine hydrolase [Pleurostoma richardsiae]
MWPLSSDGQFAFQLAEILSLSNGGGANTGEVLRAATQITAGDFESFYSEFKFLADAIHELGVTAESAGFTVSARDAYFRSSTYYRAADFFLHGNLSDPRLTTLWDSQLADFAKAISLLPIPGEKIVVQASNFTVPLYFFPGKAPGSSCGAKLPTILVGTGYDAPQEDMYHSMCTQIVARGWNCATYEGPGQSTVRRQQGLGFTPEWWTVVTPIVDYFKTRPDVDMSRLVLEGVSFGGQLAPRAAVHDDRFAAVVLVDGIWSVYDYITSQFPSQLLDPLNAGNSTAFDTIVWELYSSSLVSTQFRWVIDQGLFAFNTRSPYDFFIQLKTYTLDDSILRNVTAPIFVADGQDDTVAPGQAEQVYEALNEEAGYYVFKTELGAGEHCQIGAEAQLAMIALDWLANVFNGVNATSAML